LIKQTELLDHSVDHIKKHDPLSNREKNCIRPFLFKILFCEIISNQICLFPFIIFVVGYCPFGFSSSMHHVRSTANVNHPLGTGGVEKNMVINKVSWKKKKIKNPSLFRQDFSKL
jgi:hypothetical protein